MTDNAAKFAALWPDALAQGTFREKIGRLSGVYFNRAVARV